MAYQIKPYADENFCEWNAFLATAKNGTFLFHRNFIGYHGNRFEEASLLFYDGDLLVAIFPANRQGDTVFSHQGLSYGGLVVQPNIRLQDYLDIFSTLLAYWATRGVEKVRIKNLPPIYVNAPTAELEYICFLTDAKIVRTDMLLVVDNRTDLPLTTNRKRSIAKGFKEDFYVEENNDFASFWQQVLVPNLKAKHGITPVHSLEEIELLHRKFPREIRQFNLYTPQGELVAGVTVFETDTVAHLQYISGLPAWNERGAIDWLHHYLMEVPFKEKAFFDFGSCNEQEGRKLNKGLLYWKEGFGARAVAQHFYEIETKCFNKLQDLWI